MRLLAFCLLFAPSAAYAQAAASQLTDDSDDLCPGPGKADEARCLAKFRLNGAGGIFAGALPGGYGPQDLRQAYNINTDGGEGVTVAIIDAYDDPTAEQDLAVYRAQYGLPPCTTANGCFRKVNQNGQQGPYPEPNSNWAGEIALDIDMVSAACPKCKILLVEANTNMMLDLGAAVNRAVSMGAKIISNSYGSTEDATNIVTNHFFNHPGVSIFVSSGDDGYGVQFPASSDHVFAVGGTRLSRALNPRGFSEKAWAGAGSGCSKHMGKPSWQNDPDCKGRTLTDISAVADPGTGVAVYDSYGSGGWAVYGGTSVSSPLVAAIFASSNLAGVAPSYVYSHTAGLYPVEEGNNDAAGASSYLCASGPGFDGPTGWGTPNGGTLTGGGGSAAQPAPPKSGGTCATTTTPPTVKTHWPFNCNAGAGAAWAYAGTLLTFVLRRRRK